MNSRFVLLLLSTPLLLHALLNQSLGIRGTLRCGTKPLGNRTVQLYDKRKPPFSDKLLASNTTDSNGLFYLTGTAARVLPLSPILAIDGDCKGQDLSVQSSSCCEFCACDNKYDAFVTSPLPPLNLQSCTSFLRRVKRKIKLPSSKTDVTRTKDVIKFNDVGVINLNTR